MPAEPVCCTWYRRRILGSKFRFGSAPGTHAFAKAWDGECRERCRWAADAEVWNIQIGPMHLRDCRGWPVCHSAIINRFVPARQNEALRNEARRILNACGLRNRRGLPAKRSLRSGTAVGRAGVRTSNAGRRVFFRKNLCELATRHNGRGRPERGRGPDVLGRANEQSPGPLESISAPSKESRLRTVPWRNPDGGRGVFDRDLKSMATGISDALRFPSARWQPF